jgi:hypothetical protein
MHWLQLTITLQEYTTREKVCANRITASSFHVHASCFNDFARITVQNLDSVWVDREKQTNDPVAKRMALRAKKRNDAAMRKLQRRLNEDQNQQQQNQGMARSKSSTGILRQGWLFF